jgi:hypothetical protein
MSAPLPKLRRGRPPGTVSLTKEIATTIVSYIRAGAYDYVAAEAAGVSARTFHDWVARGEDRHPSRAATPRLRAFAQEVQKARAEARLAAEIRVHRERPTYWLSRVARTKPEREGWTDSERSKEATEAANPYAHLSDEEAREALDRMLTAIFESDASNGVFKAPPCPHPRCRCPWHKNWNADRYTRRSRRGTVRPAWRSDSEA